mmetsp:Transcript_9431/g.34622  ORF Transcript_9431/g.34622 Transcript_9431/m.34622 type:complete len:212 (-) Transcript_9431:636-1271(-)
MHSRMALKLFSLGLRRSSTLKVAYTSSPASRLRLFMSSWYCAGSSASTSVRSCPTGGFTSSGFTRPVKSFMSLPALSRISTTSAPRTYTMPARSAATRGGTSRAGLLPPPLPCSSRTSSGARRQSRKTMSCCLSASHSCLMSGLTLRVVNASSAVTAAGFTSPSLGFFTSATVNALTGMHILAQPRNFSSPRWFSWGPRREALSRMSSRIS